MNDPNQCCPPFDPEPWHGKTTTWENRKFIKDRVRCLFYVPVGFGSTMKRVMGLLASAKAECPDCLCLSDHTSRWNMDVYVATDREVPGAQMVELSGKLYSRVYEGDFRKTKDWCDDFSQQTKREGLTVKKQYMWYTTCPKCAKKYGKNQVVIIGEVGG